MFLSLETLISIIRTGLPILVELIDLVNSVIIFVSQTTLPRLLTFLLASHCGSHSPALLDSFISSEVSICSAVAFRLLVNSDHVVVSVSIDFPSYSQRDASFHCIAYDYSRADWDGLRDHFRDVPWEDIFKLSVSAAASEFCEYQVKPHSFPWFLASCAAAIVHRTFFFRLYQKDKSSESKVKFKQAINRCKRVLEAAKLAYAKRTKESITSQKPGCRTFDELPIVFSTKVNLLYLLYSTARRCCLLHLIKQNCLPKTFLRTLILMTWVSLHLFSLLEPI